MESGSEVTLRRCARVGDGGRGGTAGCCARRVPHASTEGLRVGPNWEEGTG